MDFDKKLKELRRQKGLTQEQLAEALYVSRTAVSKWESGKGYPGIESLKAIAAFFSVTVDDLLSSDEILNIAEAQQKQTENRFRDLVTGLLDICVSLLLFLPFFADRAGGVIQNASLLSLNGVSLYLRGLYFAIVLGLSVFGILTLAMQTCKAKSWQRCKTLLSMSLGSVAVLLFSMSLQPYAAAFAFSLLAVKTFLLIKRQ